MKIVEPYTLAGFMELAPQKQIKFDKIKDVILSTYQKYGFFPLDTPVIEASEVLLAKAGGETEKQIYRFNKGENDLCLRFDLTVPFAKYVAKNQGSLTFPFRRFQSGKVFRGERPQKGRFREFYQCDIDVVGDESLDISYDAEIPSIIAEIFSKLNLNFIIKINNRKILNGVFEALEILDVYETYRIIDKIKKIGKENVKEELLKLNISNKAVNIIIDLITISGTNLEKLNYLEKLGLANTTLQTGIEEIKSVIYYSKIFGLTEQNMEIDFSISRGLDYYTGTVYETFITGLEGVGSVCSGGRYDNLSSFYSTKNFPGVGISIGVSRLFYILEENNLLPNISESPSKVLFIPMNKECIEFCFVAAKQLRENNISTEVYLNDKKFKNKLSYADKLQIPYVAIVGEDEVKSEKITIKNMKERNQELLSVKEIIQKLK